MSRTVRAAKNETLPSGSVVHWAERDPNNYQRFMVTCGKCGHKRLTTIAVGKDRAQWTGFCRKCPYEKLQDERLSTGSVIHWSERDLSSPRKCWVTCGKCGERRLVWIPVGKIKQKWTGFCTDCGHRKRVKEGKHSSGTVIHWSIRHQGNGHKIEITCHGCGERRFAQYNVIDKKGWSGLCGECVRQRGPHNKNSHDETLLSRSIIHWGERDLRKPNPRFMVTCGLCGNKRLTTIFRRVDKSWTGYCREHFSNPATAHKVRFRDAKKLIRELLPRIAQAKKLAQSAWRSRSKGWRAEVHDNFPELVPMVIDILLSAKPSECALEQIAHSHFDCSGSTLKRKLREQRAVLINETQGSELTHANATT